LYGGGVKRGLGTALSAFVVVVAGPLRAAEPANDARSHPASADAHASSDGGVALPRCLELAERNHPNLLAERARLERTRGQLREAHVAPFSQFRATGGVGIAPTIRGDGIFSPNTDQSLTSNLGMAWRFEVSGAVPLWTFGKITNLWDAAEAAVKVGEQQLQITRDEVRFDVRKAYYGLLLAREAIELLHEAAGRIADAATKLEKEVDAEDGDPIDLLKLQTYQAELEARLSEAQKFEQVARAGLRFYTGVSELEIKPSPLDVAKHRLGSLPTYLAAARVHRPDVLMAHAGLQARQAQVRLAQSQMFPDFGVGMSFGASYAPEVANQINPFVLDPGNYFRYGLGLVFQWNLDFPASHARVLQAQAQLEEMVALDRKALGGVAAEVEAAHAEASDWKRRLEAFEKAEKYARKWLATVQQSIDVGTMEEKDLIDPARRWAENRYNRLNATMEYNMALAKLARVTGWDAIAPGS
jgi:outer membrane protein TolC